MSTGGNKTIRYVNTGQGQNNNQLIVLDRGQILPPTELPGAPNDCSNDPINTICGFEGGKQITTANQTTIFGVRSAEVMETGQNNTFVGHQSGRLVFGANGDTLLGANTASGLMTGSENIVIGNNAGSAFTGAEDRNIILYGSGVIADSATIRIGDPTVHIANTFMQGIHTIIPGGAGLEMVTIDSDGHMGSQASGVSDLDNTILGHLAGISITTGVDNTLIGVRAGNAQTTADDVTAVGDEAGLLANIDGNIYIGSGAADGLSSGSQMTIIGLDSCQSMTGGVGLCTVIGSTALQSATNAPNNVAVGTQVMNSLLTGAGNTIVGSLGMRNATACANNVGMGFDVLHDNLTSPSNTSIGWESGFSIISGLGRNTLVGQSCCQNLLTGASNIILGDNAASNYVGAESNNIILGPAGLATESGSIRIGINGTHISTTIEGIHGILPGGSGLQMVTIDSTGLMGSQTTAVEDADNTLVGFDAGESITSGIKNTLIGVRAGEGVTTSSELVLIGDRAGEILDQGRHVLIGSGAGEMSTIAMGSVGVGFAVLQNVTSGTGNNTAIGFQSQQLSTSGGGNTSLGSGTLGKLTTGVSNTGIGALTAFNIIAGDSNTFVGASSGLSAGLTGDGDSNTAIGANSLSLNGSGSFNTAIGRSSGNGTLTGSSNIYLGTSAGISHNAAETDNIIIANSGVAGENTTIHIGTFATHTRSFMAGISGVVPSGTPQAVIFDPLTGELGEAQITMSGSGNMAAIITIDMDHTALENDDHALEIDVDADGFGDVKALDIVYTTGAIIAGEDEEAILINIDQSASIGGHVVALEVLSTTTGSADIDALECGVGCGPILHQSGTFGDADAVLVLAVDQTVALSGGGVGNISVFLLDNDTMTIRDSAKYAEMEFILDTGASGSGIAPTYEFSDGSGPTTFAPFSPGDGTNGMRNTGAIIWELTDIPSWTVADSGDFEIRITRTRNSLTTTPIVDMVQIAATTVFSWDKDGDLIVNSIVAAGNPGVFTSSTPVADLAIPVYDSTTGSLIKETAGILTVPGVLSGLTGLTSSGVIDFNPCTTFDLGTTANSSNCISLLANGGTVSSIFIHNTTGTAIDSIDLSTSLGGIDIDSELDIQIDSNTGRIDLNAQTSTSVQAIQLNSVAGGLDINTALDVDIDAASDVFIDAALGRIDLRAVSSTDAKSVELLSSLGGITIDSNLVLDMNGDTGVSLVSNTGTIGLISVTSASTGAINMNAGSGGIDIDAATQITLNAVTIDSSDNLTGVNTLDVVGQITTGDDIVIDTVDSNRTTRYGFNAGTGSFSATGQHTAIGQDTLVAANAAGDNTAVGFMSCNVSAGDKNTGVGSFSLEKCTSGNENVAVGVDSLGLLTIGTNNTAVGNISAQDCIDGNQNCAFGFSAGNDNRGGDDEVAMGFNALTGNDNSVGQNTAVGSLSFSALQDGTNNIGLGFNSGVNYTTTESDNICIGNPGLITESSAIRLGNNTDHDFVEIPKVLRITEPSGTDFIGLLTPALAGSYTMTLPAIDAPTDERRIMTNLNGTLTWSVRSSVPFPINYLDGGQISQASVSTISVLATQCRDDTDVLNLVASSNTINIAASGINGLQTSSSEASDTWYEVLIIGDTTEVQPTAYLLLPDGTGFSQTGYDVKRRLGWIRNNSSSNIWDFDISGSGRDRYISYEETRTEMTILNSATGSVTFVTQSAAVHFPPATRIASIHCEFDLDNDGDKLFLRSGLSTPSVAETPIRWGSGIGSAAFEESDFVQTNLKLSPATPSFQYATSVAGNAIHFTAIGYELNL